MNYSKRNIILIIVSLLFLSLSIPVFAGDGPVSYYGEMIVRGNKIISSKTDQTFQVAGLSLFWSNTGWNQEKQYTKEVVDILVDQWNIEIIRASMGVDENGGYLSDPANKRRVETVIEAAIDRDIYVIIDWHSHHAEKYPGQAAAFFSEMAQKYGQYDNVIFEIYNEPLHISWETIKDYAEKVIPSIRAYSDNLIIVGTPSWSQKVNYVTDDPISESNIAYALHFYAGSHKKNLRTVGDMALNGGVAIFVTEWGSVNADGNGSVSTQETNLWIRWMDKHSLSWCNWSVSDKNEGASIWDSRRNKTAAGRYIHKKLAEHAAQAPWRRK